jgi:hypothetical protein
MIMQMMRMQLNLTRKLNREILKIKKEDRNPPFFISFKSSSKKLNTFFNFTIILFMIFTMEIFQPDDPYGVSIL